MRVLLFVVVLTFNPISLHAQSKPEWDRVYTFDESTIDMNTSVVTPISKDVSRVRFRWNFKQPQSLGGVPEITYQSQLQVMEFNCQQNTYRPYHLTFLDSAGNIVRIDDSPGEWHDITDSPMIQKLFNPACDLIKKKTRPAPSPPAEEAQLAKVTLFALRFAQDLERTKDFKPIINRFFISNYLDEYLQDQHKNWFMILDRDVASKLSRVELQRFYIALMNSGYLGALYLTSQMKYEVEDQASFLKLLPPDVLQLFKNHPYITRYQVREGDYGFMADNIGSVERVRGYTDFLEKLNSVLRQHVVKLKAAQSKQWRALQKDQNFFTSTVKVCSEQCFGLPAGTKLFEVNIPVFRLQVAEIRGKLNVVSAMNLD